MDVYVSPDTTPSEISKRTGIARGKIYQTLKFLDEEGLIDRSERGTVRLQTEIVENKLREGIAQLHEIGQNLKTLRHMAVREKMIALDTQMGDLKEIEERLRRELSTER